MKAFWLILNVSLFLLLLVAGGVAVYFIKGFEVPDLTSGTIEGAEAATQQGPVDLPGSIVFRVKGNALCQDEAVLVEGGESFKFTLRPVIDLTGDAPTSIRTYVETHPDLEERVQVELKAGDGASITPSDQGRYEFPLPKGGGDITLSFRGSLKVMSGKGTTALLKGETSLRLICPVKWEDIPPEVQKLIGTYPNATKYKNFYTRPAYWYKVTEANENWKISPHFRVGDFDLHFPYTTPQSPELNQYPQYAAINPKLILKLESIIDGLKEKGIQVETLGILAGYRSPAYNQWKKQQGGVGGKYTKGLSSHMYGAAADFYVDRDGDGVMDDMNGDGKSDQDDAFWIRDEIVDAIDCQALGDNSGLVGGCGTYGIHDIPDRTPQTANLHVDVRGYQVARWIINSHDAMVPQPNPWNKQPCPNVPTPVPSPPKKKAVKGAKAEKPEPPQDPDHGE
jgi:hypothetical protein